MHVFVFKHDVYMLVKHVKLGAVAVNAGAEPRKNGQGSLLPCFSCFYFRVLGADPHPGRGTTIPVLGEQKEKGADCCIGRAA